MRGVKYIVNSEEDLLYYCSRKEDESYHNLSNFDTQLHSAWNAASEKGYFKYELNITESETLPGKYRFYTELNCDRGIKRREPQEINSMDEPFNPNLFNFTKIPVKEIMFNLKWKDEADNKKNLLVINISPIGHGHSLILPEVDRKIPQELTEYSIEIGLRLLLLSGTAAFRIGFNSKCGYASVNHLHLHCYYVKKQMLLEDIELKPLEGPCWQLVDYPAKGFVFPATVKEYNDLLKLSRDVFKLTNFLQQRNEAHNLCMTRSNSQQCNVRVYVWARKPTPGIKYTKAVKHAFCEFFGHVSYKDKEVYRNKNEKDISESLENLTSDAFHRLNPAVRDLYRN